MISEIPKEFKYLKFIVVGLPGSGKTHWTKTIIRKKKLRMLVYSPHAHDWSKENVYYYKPKDFGEKKEVEKVWSYAKELGKKGLIDGLVFDEMDVAYKTSLSLGRNSKDVIGSHRHYKLILIGLARRPQDIPTHFVESTHCQVYFAIEGDNLVKKLNGRHKGLGEMVKQLQYKDYNYVIKEIGKIPIRMKPIK